jgi:hypothetical protein
MTLAIPLESNQIAAAKLLHQRLEQWQMTDTALAALGAQFPGFAPHETLLKVTAINALYGTNVYAVPRLAKHVANVMAQSQIWSLGPELVEQLAVPRSIGDIKGRRHYSFASKFAHFFVNPNRYPIMDKYATQMLKLHLGRVHFVADPDHPYVAFSRCYELLKKEACFTGSNREMDHYLWLAGEFVVWRNNRDAPINGEVRTLFDSPSSEIAAELDALMSSILSKAFRGEL